MAALALCAAAGLESMDRYGNSSTSFANQQIWRDFSGKATPIEKEAQILLGQVAAATGLEGVALTRTGLADRLALVDVSAQFNPSNFRISLDERLAERPLSERRSIMLHEIGHAVAFSMGARPNASTGDPQADDILAYSLLSNQIFQESFADAFAAAWALRENPSDSYAWSSLAKAAIFPEAHASPAHETTIALRLVKKRLAEILSAPPRALPSLIASIASQATALTVAQLGAEREAACHMGARGAARFAMDMGYESFYLPWEMAQTFPISPADPMAHGLATLAKLRGQSAGKDAWGDSLARARPAIEAALAAARNGADPDQASQIATSGMALAHQNALPRELDAVAFAAKLSASSRAGWRADAALGLMRLTDYLFPAPTQGCRPAAAPRTIPSLDGHTPQLDLPPSR